MLIAREGALRNNNLKWGKIMELTKSKRNFLVTLLSFMVGMIYFIPYIRISFYDQTIAALRLTNAQLGYLGSIYGTLAIFCYAIGGVLAQKVSPRLLIAVSLAGTGAATLWQASYPSYGSLMVIFALYAFFTTATLWSPYITLMRSFGSDAEQGRLFGISEALRSIVSSVVGFLFIWIFSLFSNEMGGYRAILLIAAGIYFVFAALAFVFFPSSVKAEKKESAEKGSIFAALRLPGVWLVGLFIFFCYALNCGGAYYFGTYTTQVLHTSEAVSSSLQILRTYILAIGLGVVGGVVIDKFRYRSRFLILSLAGATVASALLPFLSGQIWVAIVVSVLISGINYMIKSVYYSIMDEALIPRELTGAASGIIAFLAYVPDAFITAMVGVWLDQDIISGFQKLFAFMAFCGAAAIVLAVLINIRYMKNERTEK